MLQTCGTGVQCGTGRNDVIDQDDGVSIGNRPDLEGLVNIGESLVGVQPGLRPGMLPARERAGSRPAPEVPGGTPRQHRSLAVSPFEDAKAMRRHRHDDALLQIIHGRKPPERSHEAGGKEISQFRPPFILERVVYTADGRSVGKNPSNSQWPRIDMEGHFRYRDFAGVENVPARTAKARKVWRGSARPFTSARPSGATRRISPERCRQKRLAVNAPARHKNVRNRRSQPPKPYISPFSIHGIAPSRAHIRQAIDAQLTQRATNRDPLCRIMPHQSGNQ